MKAQANNSSNKGLDKDKQKPDLNRDSNLKQSDPVKSAKNEKSANLGKENDAESTNDKTDKNLKQNEDLNKLKGKRPTPSSKNKPKTPIGSNNENSSHRGKTPSNKEAMTNTGSKDQKSNFKKFQLDQSEIVEPDVPTLPKK